MAALRHVPAPFFQEAFDLDQQQLWEQLQVAAAAGGSFALQARQRLLADGPCWRLGVQVECEAARQQSLDLLSGYLDIVETHLVQDIAARTGEFVFWC